MAIDMTPEQRVVGEANFKSAVESLGLDRRGFLKASMVGAAALGGSAAAVYYGYQTLQGRPVRAALIGGGDEGGVLVGEHNPEFLKFVAVCDIRPSNVKRIYEGDPKVALRKGFRKVYGFGVDNPSSPDYIQSYTDYKKMLERPDIEAVVIATPLHLHAPMAIDCMKAGKHVLCEKLMARTTKQCKDMIRTAKETKRVLSIGHQRHYSMLYSHAQEVMKSGILGEVKHIRALWHRNFTWPYEHDPKLGKQVPGITEPAIRDGWFQPVLEGDYDALKDAIEQYGYESVEQLIRWRLYEKTGGGLMAELGSHQLDAASIFLGKVKPLAVSGTGMRSFFGPRKNPREIDDHVFTTYEFPGQTHPRGKAHGRDDNDIVVVTYSSISTNGFEAYGECLMGSRGTMVVEAEQRVMLYTEKDPRGKKTGDPKMMQVDVTALKKDAAAADSSSTWGGPSAAGPTKAGGAAASGPISRGYREEMEDFAYCVRTWDDKLGYEKDDSGAYKQRLPRCHGEVAMADAIIALTSNIAMKKRRRIVFENDWFDADKDAVPETA
jgi:predicted dehydrogenase